MKQTRKIWSFLGLLALLMGIVLLFSACTLNIPVVPDSGIGTPDDDAQTPDNDNPNEDDDQNEDDNNSSDEDDENAKIYIITFSYGGTNTQVPCKENEIPKAPELIDREMGSYRIHFLGWDKEIVKATENTKYTALYEIRTHSAQAIFVMGDVSETVEYDYDNKPKPPSEVPDYRGMKFVCWDREIVGSLETQTYYAVYYDPTLHTLESMQKAYNCALLAYPTSTENNDNGNSALSRATALYSMVLQEHENPQGGGLAKKIVEHLRSVTSKDKAPAIDACCYWNYNPLTAAIALARVTPSVWDTIPADIKVRIATLMEAYIYLESFATSDYNAFATGPSMKGNYNKTWNPNYRLANIPVMVYATYYYGNGDIELGAKTVNEYIKGFDETVYTKIVNNFQKYGWRRAFLTWTADGRTTSDGTFTGGSAKELLCYGGFAVGDDTSTASDLQVKLGSGAGVANLDQYGKPRDYLYGGASLDNPEAIVRNLINYNYSGGQVKSEHWYDIDGDGVKDIVAWIYDETKSPYEGMEGMMKEFASGNRSSTGYCSHDFVLTTILLSAVRSMELYTTNEDGERVPLMNKDGTQEVVFDYTKDEEFWMKIQVGNEDLIYKAISGYQCYATGSYGVSSSVGYESTGTDYRITKAIWRTRMLQDGTIEIAESFKS